MRERHTGSVRLRGADRARDKTTAAIGADILQPGLNAVGAEGAFIAANTGVGGVGRKICIAEFAIRSEVQGHVEIYSGLIGGDRLVI
tara:strand:- start:4497 stop:4757 length:261 start_codon:yes stop_codon:yes gene_type:complete